MVVVLLVGGGGEGECWAAQHKNSDILEMINSSFTHSLLYSHSNTHTHTLTCSTSSASSILPPAHSASTCRSQHRLLGRRLGSCPCCISILSNTYAALSGSERQCANKSSQRTSVGKEEGGEAVGKGEKEEEEEEGSVDEEDGFDGVLLLEAGIQDALSLLSLSEEVP